MFEPPGKVVSVFSPSWPLSVEVCAAPLQFLQIQWGDPPQRHTNKPSRGKTNIVWSLHRLSMFRKDNNPFYSSGKYSVSFQNSSILFLSCKELHGPELWALLFLRKQLHQVCLSFGGPTYFTKGKINTCNQFTPNFLTADQTLQFSNRTKVAGFSNAARNSVIMSD